MNTISILTALDENYLSQLQVLLTSIYLNNPGEQIALWLLHSGLSQESLVPVRRQCRAYRYTFLPVQIDGLFFRDAPVNRRYPKEMYYRLLAPYFLPDTMDRVLYLDPDILIINPLRELWETDFGGKLFAAAAHTGMTELIGGVNRLRLGSAGRPDRPGNGAACPEPAAAEQHHELCAADFKNI